MYSSIDSLINILKSQAPTNKSIEEIEGALNRITTGVSVPNARRTELFDVAMRLKHKSQWRIKEEAQKVVEKIRRERLTDAQSFYKEYGQNVSHVEISIDPNYEVIQTVATRGMVLYQWCKMFESGGEFTLYDSKTGKCMIGNYFSTSRVSPESLGFFRSFNIYSPSGRPEGVAQQVCCRFELPFFAPCLVSTAKGAFDHWNVHHYHDGTEINKEEIIGDIKVKKEPFKGIWTSGGATQVFIPLNESQRKELAQIAQLM